jgi:hypothetical protein
MKAVAVTPGKRNSTHLADYALRAEESMSMIAPETAVGVTPRWSPARSAEPQ